MKDPIEKRESAPAVKAGESPAASKSFLSSRDVEEQLASYLAEEDAGEKPETKPKGEQKVGAEEIPAAAHGETPEGKTIEGQEGEHGESTGDEESNGEGETEAEAQGEKAEGEEGEHEHALPAEMQAALDAWEAKGGALPDALQRVVNKRIGRLTGERDQAKQAADAAAAKAAALEAENAQLKADPRRQAAAAPTVMDEGHLAKLESNAEAFLIEAENYVDGTASEAEKARVEKFMESQRLDVSGLKRQIKETTKWLSRDLPAHREQVKTFKAQEAAAEPKVKQYFPWLDDKASPEYAEAQQVLHLAPELRQRTPAHRLAQAVYVLGLRVFDEAIKGGVQGDVLAEVRKRFAGTASTTKTPPVKTPPPATPAGSTAATAATRRTSKAGASEAASEKLRSKPTRENATELARMALMDS